MLQLSQSNRRRLLYALILLAGIAADQISKAIAVAYLCPVGSVYLWEGVFHLSYVENPGAAFGMLAEHRWVFLLFSTVAICALGFYLFRGKSWFSQDGKGAIPLLSGIALALIVSGGIGNMIDRIALGYVVDFFYFALIDFAVFNVADSFVCVGCGLLVLSLLLQFLREKKEKKQ